MPRLTVLMGAPGSGKSTYAKQSGATVVTTDGTRERGQTPGDAIHQSYSQVKQALAAGHHVMVDTTGCNSAFRKGLVTIARKYGAELDARVMDTPVNVCVESQHKREHPVDAAVVRRVHDSVRQQTAGLTAEGFKDVKIVRRVGKEYG